MLTNDADSLFAQDFLALFGQPQNDSEITSAKLEGQRECIRDFLHFLVPLFYGAPQRLLPTKDLMIRHIKRSIQSAVPSVTIDSFEIKDSQYEEVGKAVYTAVLQASGRTTEEMFTFIGHLYGHTIIHPAQAKNEKVEISLRILSEKLTHDGYWNTPRTGSAGRAQTDRKTTNTVACERTADVPTPKLRSSMIAQLPNAKKKSTFKKLRPS